MLVASESQGQASCDARSVGLDVLDAAAPPSAEHAQQLETLARSVADELKASRVAVCAPSATRVQIRATLPDWQHASIRLEAGGTPALQRDLDVSKLPPEARALAIASATDELVRSAFIEPAAPAARVAEAAPAAALDRTDRGAAQAVAPAGLPPAPLGEVGLALSAFRYNGQRDALGADLAARYWLLPRLPISLRLGLGQRLSRRRERGDVQPAEDLHAALESGFVLWSQAGAFDLIAEAGVHLSRVAFDQRWTEGEQPQPLSVYRRTSDIVFERAALPEGRTQRLDRDWALAASVGLEGRFQTGPIGLSLALAGLLPLSSARSDWGNDPSFDSVGVQLRAGVWMLLGSRAVPATDSNDR